VEKVAEHMTERVVTNLRYHNRLLVM
jgi:hypothetical protein